MKGKQAYLSTFFILIAIFSLRINLFEIASSYFLYPTMLLAKKAALPALYCFELLQSKKKLIVSLKKIRNRNEKLLEENIKLKASLHFQEDSQDLREFQKRYKLASGRLSRVLIKNFSDDSHYFIVDKGSMHGIKKDMVAIYKFQIIGKVISTMPFYSKITLLSDPTCKVSAYANNTSAQGIVMGSRKPNSCRFEYVSHLSKVEKDDIVISSGQGLVFPEGFCLGKIVDCQEKELCYKIELEPLVNFSSIEYCSLINHSEAINF